MTEPEMYSEREPTLAAAWSRAFLGMARPPQRDLSPFLVSIAAGPDGQPIENEGLRSAIDACLEEIGELPIEKVAKTIFPQAIWTRVKGNRHALYDYYREYLPDYVSMAPTKNNLGTYFARLIGFGLDPKTGSQEDHLPSDKLQCGGNQLEYIITACKPKAQRMALQVAIYDPVRDQTEARRHFPCLQQITFIPDFQRKTLTLNAFYALQLLFVKAYGNWLGLMRLGSFIASQTDLRFERLNMHAGVQKMTSETRPRSGPLLEHLTELAKSCSVPTPVEVRK